MKKPKYGDLSNYLNEKRDPSYMAASWVLDYLAESNGDVAILVDSDDKPIYSSMPVLGKEAPVLTLFKPGIWNLVKSNNVKLKTTKFWDVAKYNLIISICGVPGGYHRDAIVDMYRKHYEKYCGKLYPFLDLLY